ncbi:O-antigen ligase family protein [Roseiconus lacunae]|uniref:O-antigen ligase family protein n=1 Tax=Roseiconus lacunae TaxID=2605694 RepID=UPI001E376757|nr:O-antigen ligase family protein [Roseiconus lacunae]MCD0458891.1 O-antigen ligase family protein [Roseiconus lacunae]
MLGFIFVFTLLFLVCTGSLARPHIGLIGFYGFVLLDPTWNWRWSLPEGVQYQKFIFASLLMGLILSGLSFQVQSGISKVGLICISVFYALCLIAASGTVAPVPTEFFMGVIWKQLLVLAIAILIIDTPEKIKAFLVAAVLAQGYNAFQINLEYFQTGFSRFAYRPWGSTGADNNGYSIITIPLMLTAVSLGFFEKKLWKRLLFFGIALLQVHQIMLMQSRGCMLAGIFSIGIAVWYMPKINGNIRWVLGAALVATVLAGPSVVEEFSSSFAGEEERDSSAESRFHLWRAGWRITMDYPISGVGPNAARVLVPDPQYYEGGLEQSNKALHNLFFDVSTGVGIPGFLVYMFLYIAPCWYCFRSYRPRLPGQPLEPFRLSVFTGIVGYLVASFFSSGLLFESCYILVAVGFCISNIDAKQQSQGSPFFQASQRGSQFVRSSDCTPAAS